MNIFKILTLGMTFYNLNKGMAEDGKKIMEECMDVLEVISASLKDNSITNAEKKPAVKKKVVKKVTKKKAAEKKAAPSPIASEKPLLNRFAALTCFVFAIALARPFARSVAKVS